MATIVLVHGAWGGSYGFRKIRPILHRAGHDVFTPSLTGIGERSHLTHPGVDLSLHVDDHHMGRVEDAHMVIMHMICYYFMDREAPAEA